MYWDYGREDGDPVEVVMVDLPDEARRALREIIRADQDVTNLSEIGF